MSSVPVPVSTHKVSEGDLSTILQEIAAKGKQVEQNDAGSKEALLEEARKLVTLLESPLEVIYGCILAEPSRMLACRMALDLKFFDTLAAGGGRPKSVDELAKPTNCSPKLAGRLLRHLAAVKMVEQTGEEEYAQNNVTRYLEHPKYREGICYSFDAVGPSLGKLPTFLAQNKLQNPEDTNAGPFQFAHNTPSHWTWLEQNPRVLQAFQDYLSGVREDRPNFMDQGFYPVSERLITGLKPGDGSAFVDVGGGRGHSLAEFKAKVPDWPGRLVLQEQNSVVKLTAKEAHAGLIEPVVHDFFKEQPLKGARAYYMRYILHDWPDAECRTILKHLRDAMEPGYSRILIHECVVGDMDPSWQHTSLDIFMMALFATQERTEKEWRALLESAGLTVSGIWHKGKGNLSLIEAVVEK